jgi:putative restriction endonuclease
VKYFVGITDDDWFYFLAARKADEVNFWRPGAQANWGPIPEGAPFLFKLHAPNNYIVGGGYFVKHTVLPLSLAWLAYGAKNGTETLNRLRDVIAQYRRDRHVDVPHDPAIGCTLLAQPFYWPRDQWIPVPPNWPMNLVQGMTLNSEDGEMGQELWVQVQPKLAGEWVRSSAASPGPGAAIEGARYGTPQIVKPRLGQGAFRVLVTDAYHRKCAITGEKTLPVLEAAHIKPYAEEGPHSINNGLLLRSDLHILFDRRYLAVDQDLKVRVSPKIREEFKNGRDYYIYDGQKLKVVPEKPEEEPLREYLEWHLRERFLA